MKRISILIIACISGLSMAVTLKAESVSSNDVSVSEEEIDTEAAAVEGDVAADDAVEENPTSGILENGLKWSIENNKLIIEKQEAVAGQKLPNYKMPDYTTSQLAPWHGQADQITSIAVKAGVKRIGNYAFYNLKKVTSAAMSSSLAEIGSSSYQGCTSLKSISFYNSLKKIEANAFYGCSRLVTVKTTNAVLTQSVTKNSLPSSLNTIGKNAFFGCSQLTALEIQAGFLNTTLAKAKTDIGLGKYKKDGQIVSNDFMLYVYGYQNTDYEPTAGQTLAITQKLNYKIVPFSGKVNDTVDWEITDDGVLRISGTGNLTSDTTSMTHFYRRRLDTKSVEIPEGITKIDTNVFDGFSELKTCVLPSSLITIDKWAFRNCTKLKDIEFPQNLTYIKDYAFQGCISLEKITVPIHVVQIGASAFQDCTSLKEVVLEDGVGDVLTDCFLSCTSLFEFHVPKSVNYMGNRVFGMKRLSNNKLEKITGVKMFVEPGSVAEQYAKENGIEYSYEHPWNITTLQEANCVSTGKRRYQCKVCKLVKEEEIPVLNHSYEQNFTIDQPASCEQAGEKSKHCKTKGCTAITEKTLIPATGHDLELFDGKMVCKKCNRILAKNGDKIVHSASGLSVKITNLQKKEVSVSGYVNQSKSKISIPKEIVYNGITYHITGIDKGAFKNNKKLKSITICENVSKIGKDAFLGCKNLKTVNIKTKKLTTKKVGKNAFKNISEKASVYVPKKKKDYKKMLKKKGLSGKKQKVTLKY